MIDTTYIKYNTSIQTATNTTQLQEDQYGAVKAQIELALPDDLFSTAGGPSKIEKIEMKTSKMRLSLVNTPIASIPIDQEKTTETTVTSTAELDVYPFCLLDNDQLQPKTYDAVISCPWYKDHKLNFNILQYTINPEDPTDISTIALETVETYANTPYAIPQSSPYYNILSDIYKKCCHMMNLCAKSNHEPYSFDVQRQQLLVQNIGTLEQMLQDALENALTFAYTQDEIAVDVYFVNESQKDLVGIPDNAPFIIIPGANVKLYYWKWNLSDTIEATKINHLLNAFKPRVRISEQSLSIEYDTAPFNEVVPIIWNSPYVNTWDIPEQMTLDTIRKEIWSEPPPKRVYKYGVTNSGSAFNFSLSNINCAALNIIANKAFRDTFNFLPWITLNPSQLPDFNTTQSTPSPPGIRSFIVREYDKQYRTYDQETEYVVAETSVNTATFPRASIFHLTGTNEFNPPEADPNDFFYVMSIEIFNGEDPNDRSKWRVNNFKIGTHTSLGNDDSDILNLGDVISHTTFTNVGNTILPTVIQSSYTSEDPSLTPGTELLSTSTTIDGERTKIGEILTPSSQSTITYINFNGNGFVLATPLESANNWANVDGERTIIPPYEPDYKILYNTLTTKTQWRYLWKIHNSADATIPNVKNYNNVVIRQLTYQTPKITTESYRTITVNQSNPVIPAISSTSTNFYPNLSLTDGKFYMLDGTTAEITISDPEPILIGDENIGKYKVVKEIEVETKRYEYPDLIEANASVPESEFDPPNGKWGNGYLDSEYIRGLANQTVVKCQNFDDYSDLQTTTVNDVFCLHVRMESMQYNHLDHPTATYEMLWGETLRTPLRWDQNTPIGGTVLTSRRRTMPTETTDSREEYYTDIGEEGTTQEVEEHETPRTFVRYNLAPTTKYLRSYNLKYPANEDTSSYSGITVDAIDFDDSYAYNEIYNQFRRWRFEGSTSDCVSPLYPENDWMCRVPPDNQIYALYLKTHGLITELLEPSAVDCYYYWKPYINYGNLGHPEQHANIFYSLNNRNTEAVYENSVVKTTTTTTVTQVQAEYVGNVHLKFQWNNLPIVTLSPIQSIVLTLSGVEFTQEMHPINIADRTNLGSALTTVIPIAENFYSLAQSLRDLHDELVIVKEEFDNTATYTMANRAGSERNLILNAKYIMKDGTIHDIFIPKNGVFTVQLTFKVTFYSG